MKEDLVMSVEGNSVEERVALLEKQVAMLLQAKAKGDEDWGGVDMSIETPRPDGSWPQP